MGSRAVDIGERLSELSFDAFLVNRSVSFVRKRLAMDCSSFSTAVDVAVVASEEALVDGLGLLGSMPGELAAVCVKLLSLKRIEAFGVPGGAGTMVLELTFFCAERGLKRRLLGVDGSPLSFELLLPPTDKRKPSGMGERLRRIGMFFFGVCGGD